MFSLPPLTLSTLSHLIHYIPTIPEKYYILTASIISLPTIYIAYGYQYAQHPRRFFLTILTIVNATWMLWSVFVRPPVNVFRMIGADALKLEAMLRISHKKMIKDLSGSVGGGGPLDP